jgi:PAS domain S-box-containing protein
MPDSAEAEYRAIAALIRLMGGCTEVHDLAGEVVTYLRGWSGCEAIGLRLRDGEDYPYFETLGFPRPFVLKESHLCVAGEDGAPLKDADGRPILECMCGNVIRGRVDPSLPFFTGGGSFWSNSTTELLATTSDAERQAHTRNFCNKSGYESVALVPIRHGPEILGVLQFNDHRRGRFSRELISVFERFGECVGIALSEKLAAKKFKEGQERFRSLFESSLDGILEISAGGKILSANPAAERILARSEAEIIAGGSHAVFDPSDPRFETGLGTQRLGGSFSGRIRMMRGTGQAFEAELESSVFHGRGGEERIWKIFRDISELKQAQDELEALARKREWLVRDSYHRVKNNLMVVESLLSLQMGELRGQPAYSGLFLEAKNRVHAMLLIHETLHLSADLEKIAAASYVERLVSGLMESFSGGTSAIAIDTEIQDMPLDADMALSCGLILNELISNAHKHGFVGRSEGRILVVLRRERDSIHLSVEDNGVGLKEGLDLARVKTLGLRIVAMKAAELGGRLVVEAGAGSKFVVDFPARA